MLLVEADISGEWDSRTDWSELARSAVNAAIRHSAHARLADRAAEAFIRFASDEDVRVLNRDYRGKDKATNVLSFPMADAGELAGAADGPELLLGDIVLAHGVCAREAEEKGVSVEAHAAHLVVHGALHLLGYDHETGEGNAEAMEEVERRALAAIGVADPYLTEVQS